MIKLAVDGYALLYYLYFSNNFNCVCGGQYMQFADYTRTYMSNLLKCGFSPFVSSSTAAFPQTASALVQARMI